MNLLTIGDFYRRRYNRAVEVLTTLAIVVSYLGWVGARSRRSASSSTWSPTARSASQPA